MPAVLTFGSSDLACEAGATIPAPTSAGATQESYLERRHSVKTTVADAANSDPLIGRDAIAGDCSRAEVLRRCATQGAPRLPSSCEPTLASCSTRTHPFDRRNAHDVRDSESLASMPSTASAVRRSGPRTSLLAKSQLVPYSHARPREATPGALAVIEPNSTAGAATPRINSPSPQAAQGHHAGSATAYDTSSRAARRARRHARVHLCKLSRIDRTDAAAA